MANLKDINYGIGKYLEASDASSIPDIGTNRKNLDLLNFKVATNNAYNLYNFKDGMIDAYQTQEGVDTSGSTNEVYDSSNKYYSGSQVGTITGGTITTHGVYKVHTFTGSGTFTTNVAGTADILLVAGGGGSGGSHAGAGGGGGGAGGGGGGGGVRALSSQSVSAAGHTVTVGTGGIAGTTGGATGGTGGNSSFGATSASGGGGGGYGTTDTGTSTAGNSGGSGGGGGFGTHTSLSGGSGNAGSYSPVEGYAGGTGGASATTGAGSGGGAGAAGSQPTSSNSGSNGGAGLGNDWRTGSTQYYGGGGGGAGVNTSTAWPGGSGGGGVSGSSSNGYIGTVGTANTGGGAGGSHGGGGSHRAGAAGGSGIVVVRYNASTGFVSYNNMTLVSNAQTAQAQPDTARITVFDEPSTGSTTANTDIKAYASRDNGTTYTQITLTDDGEYESGKKLLSGSADISGQPAGTSMRYKIETLNQSSSKITRLHGVSLQWA